MFRYDLAFFHHNQAKNQMAPFISKTVNDGAEVTSLLDMNTQDKRLSNFGVVLAICNHVTAVFVSNNIFHQITEYFPLLDSYKIDEKVT
jgi:hypothetical protein